MHSVSMITPSKAAPDDHVTTVTSEFKEDIFHSGWTPHIDATGFDAGSDWWYYAGTFGSIADDTYTDGSLTERTISSCYHDSVDIVQFTLAGTGISNSDDTFVSIEIDSVTLLRTDANYVSDNANVGTTWYWSSITPGIFDGANPDNFTVHLS